jgi:hypothetical protein
MAIPSTTKRKKKKKRKSKQDFSPYPRPY